MALRIGLTGGLACGKSTVARIMAAEGAHILDADEIARDLVAPGTPAITAIAKHFGPAFLQEDGSLDRAALRALVFRDPQARRWLEDLLHPSIRRVFRERTAGIVMVDPQAIVVWVVPLLVEGGYGAELDGVVVVDCRPDQQRARALARPGWTPADVEGVCAAQCSREERLRHADWVIDNSGSPEETARQVQALLATLRRRAAQTP